MITATTRGAYPSGSVIGNSRPATAGHTVPGKAPSMNRPRPTRATERATSVRRPTSGFSVGRALREVGRGWVNGFKDIAKTFKERPIMSFGVLGGLIGASLLWPTVVGIAVPAVAIGVAGYRMTQGVGSAIRDMRRGKPRQAEKDLEKVGEGLTGLTLLGGGMVLGEALSAFRNAGLVHLVDDAPIVMSFSTSLIEQARAHRASNPPRGGTA